MELEYKLIELSDTHLIVDDSEISVNDWVYSMDGIHQWFGLVLKSEPSPKKITHSTQPLGIIHGENGKETITYGSIGHIPLSEVEELINGYSVKKLAEEKYPYKLSSGARKAGFIDGFKAHQELVKDKFTLSKDDIEKIIHAAMVFEFDSDSIDLGVSVLTSAIIKSLLPPTEWNVKFNEEGKLEFK